MKRIRVLIVVSSLDAGGLEAYVANVLSVLDRDRFGTTVVSTRRPGGWYEDRVRELGADVQFCENRHSQIGYVRRIGRLMRTQGVDVACDFRGDFAAPTLWAARCLGVRSRVVMWRSTRVGFRLTPMRRAYTSVLHACAKRWATRILGNTRSVLNAHYPGWEQDSRFGVVYNGVDVERFRPDRPGNPVRKELGIPPGRLVVGHVGRFHPSKNHEILVRVFGSLCRRRNDLHLLLVGDGPDRGVVERMMQEHGIRERVTLAGVRRDIPELLCAMDIFLFPSRYEGMPNALVEAMACGRPIVASDIPEIVEILPETLHGQLCPVDDAAAFERKVAILCEDAGLRGRLGELGVSWVRERFSLSASVKTLVEHWMAPIEGGA